MKQSDELKNSGLKATLPRIKVLEIFQTATQRHMSAEDVYKLLLADGSDVGRNLSTMELTISFPMVIRDSVSAAATRYADVLSLNGTDDMGNEPVLGPPEAIADTIRPYPAMGFSTVIARMPAPFDDETITRMAEVQALLAR